MILTPHTFLWWGVGLMFTYQSKPSITHSTISMPHFRKPRSKRGSSAWRYQKSHRTLRHRSYSLVSGVFASPEIGAVFGIWFRGGCFCLSLASVLRGTSFRKRPFAVFPFFGGRHIDFIVYFSFWNLVLKPQRFWCQCQGFQNKSAWRFPVGLLVLLLGGTQLQNLNNIGLTHWKFF